MRGVEFGHHGGDCTFETMLRRHELNDPVLWRIAEIVHEADLDDERFDAPEAPGLDVVLRGLSMVCDDEQVLAVTGPMFDGLYEYFRRELLLGGSRHDRPDCHGRPPAAEPRRAAVVRPADVVPLARRPRPGSRSRCRPSAVRPARSR